MASTVVNSTKGRGNGTGAFASGSFNSTNGNAILVQIREAIGQGGTSAPTDNVVGSPNTYSLISTVSDTTGSQTRTYRCDSITGRSGMVVSVSYSSSADSSFGVVEIAGSTGYSAALSSVVADGSQPWTTNTGTPLAVGDLAIAFMSNGGGLQTITWAGGFSKLANAEENDGNSWWPGSMAQATSAGTGALSPSCTSTAGTQAVIGVVVFPSAGGGPTAYELAVDPASYALTTAAETATATRALAIAPQSYAVTTAPVNLAVGRAVNFAPASYSLTAAAETLTAARALNIEPVAYVLSGADVDLEYQSSAKELIVEPAGYVLTLADVALEYAQIAGESQPEVSYAVHKKRKKPREKWSGVPFTRRFPDVEPETIQVIEKAAEEAAQQPKPPSKSRAISFLNEYGIQQESLAQVLIEIEQIKRLERRMREEDEVMAVIACCL